MKTECEDVRIVCREQKILTITLSLTLFTQHNFRALGRIVDRTRALNIQSQDCDQMINIIYYKQLEYYVIL